jgi:hypothetical protein
MKSINILGDRNLTLANIQEMRHTGTTRTYYVSDNRFCTEFPDGHIFFDYNTDLSDWQDTLEKLPFQAAAVIMLVYQNAANVRHVLTQPDFPKNVYVDNEFGMLLPLQEYVETGMPMEE